MSYLNLANKYMGKTIYEQRELESESFEEVVEEVLDTEDDTEIETEIDPVDGEEDVEMDDTEEVEEEPTITMANAIKAIQLVINGEAETAEEALDLVKEVEDLCGEM